MYDHTLEISLSYMRNTRIIIKYIKFLNCHQKIAKNNYSNKEYEAIVLKRENDL